MRLGWHHWLAASVAAILAHAGMAAVFLVAERSTGETKVAGGEIEVTLSVTAPSTVADTVTAPEVNPVAPTEPEAAETPEIVPEVIEPLDTAEDFATVEDPADYVVGATAEDAPATSPSTTPRTSVGTPVAVDGARNDYFSLLRAWLERHKEYPRNARLKRQEGTGRVGGGIAAPRPPQSRACAIDALGSSPDRFAHEGCHERTNLTDGRG